MISKVYLQGYQYRYLGNAPKGPPHGLVGQVSENGIDMHGAYVELIFTTWSVPEGASRAWRVYDEDEIELVGTGDGAVNRTTTLIKPRAPGPIPDEVSQKPPRRPRLTSKDTNPKDAVGIRKAPVSCVSAIVLQQVEDYLGRPIMPAVVFLLGLGMMEGARKYGRHNYRVAGVRASVYYDATLRHVSQWLAGQDVDTDSGLPHLVKAIASLFVLWDAHELDKLTDDRPPAGPPWRWRPYRELPGTNRGVMAIDALMDIEQTLRAWWEGDNFHPGSTTPLPVVALGQLVGLVEAVMIGDWTDNRGDYVMDDPDWLQDLNAKASVIIDKYPVESEPYTETEVKAGKYQ